jgi:hypothetical protein
VQKNTSLGERERREKEKGDREFRGLFLGRCAEERFSGRDRRREETKEEKREIRTFERKNKEQSEVILTSSI